MYVSVFTCVSVYVGDYYESVNVNGRELVMVTEIGSRLGVSWFVG